MDISRKPRQVVLATTNLGKIADFKELLAPLGWDFISPLSLGAIMPTEGTGATGATLESNAQLKAETVCKETGLWALADDSGLFVEAFPEKLGVDTALFGGPEQLLKLMAQQTNRRAQFQCVLALARPGLATLFFKGIDEGSIALKPEGQGGFGYDPVFIQAGEHLTHSQRIEIAGLAAAKVEGHRGKAVAALLKWALINADVAT